jgi:hypothetical protein
MATSGGPKWWLLYLGLVVIMILFVGEIKLPVPEIEHRVVEVVIVLAAFGVTHLWLNANTSELLYRPRRKARALREKQVRTQALPVKRLSSGKED